jgi:hypothetical protein
MTMPSRLLFIALIFSVAGCAGTDTESPVADDVTHVAPTNEAPRQAVTPGEETTVQAPMQEGEPGGTVDEEEAVPLLDRTQQTVDSLVLGTVQKVDNIFGSVGVEEEASITRGRLSVGGQYDERDGFRGRFRLKARFQLPALRMERATIISIPCPTNSTTSRMKTGCSVSVSAGTRRCGAAGPSASA